MSDIRRKTNAFLLALDALTVGPVSPAEQKELDEIVALMEELEEAYAFPFDSEGDEDDLEDWTAKEYRAF